VRPIPNLPAGSLLSLLTGLLLLVPGSAAQAQLATRSFLTVLWSDHVSKSPNPTPTSPVIGVDADIDAFFVGYGDQPEGRSVAIGADAHTPISQLHFDWSRVVALVFDEPYTPDCNESTLANDIDIDQALAARAAELRAIAPATRFWVNFTDKQIRWMLDGFGCPYPYNKAYIDVISLDGYGQSFRQDLYEGLMGNPAKPSQQVAFVPGTFYAPKQDDQADYLPEYFRAADYYNQQYSLPLGDLRWTGTADGCPVWMVLGWLAGNWNDGKGTQYYGMFDPSAGRVADIWRREVAVPLRADLSHSVTRGQVIQAILPVLVDE